MDNRSRILDTALQLIAARGYDAIGVQEICEAAGITKPTLYHYFGSKRGVLEALVRERCEPLLDELERAAEYQGYLPHNLDHIAETYFQFARREPALCRMLLAFSLAVPSNEAYELIVAFNRRQQQLVEQMFSLAVKDHGNMRGRQRAYAATFIGMLNTYAVLGLNGQLLLDRRVREQAVKQFSHGIYS